MPHPGDPNLTDIVVRIAAGNRDAETKFVLLFDRTVRAIIGRWRVESDLAQDLYQDVFILLLQRLRSGAVREPRAIAAFVDTAVARFVANHRRKLRRRRTDGDVDALHVPDGAPTVLTYLVRGDEARVVRRAIRRLKSHRDRAVLYRLYIASEERESIRADLSLTNAQFDRVVSRARRRLRQLIEADRATLVRGSAR